MKADNRLTLAYVRTHPADAARALEKLPQDAIARLAETLDPELGGPLLGHMMPDVVAAVLDHCEPGQAGDLLDAMPAAAVTRVARAAGPHGALRELLDDPARAGSRPLLRYPPHSVGSHMAPIDAALPDDLTATEVLRRVRQRGATAECEIWLVDRGYRLSGIAQVTALLQAGAADTVGGLKRPAPPALPARMSITIAREQTAWQTRRRLPVTDDDGILVGVIDYQTVLEATRADDAPTDRYDALDSVFELARIYWIAIAGIVDTVLDSRTPQRAADARGDDRHGR